jgi:phospholipid/cholesterol/gamma-HCH transport system substrate-binding protein
MTGKTNYVLVGLFVLVLSFTFVAGVLWLGAGGPGRVYDEYLVFMQESVAGLSRDNAVKYHGVDVGRVHAISLDPERAEEVRLLLEIDPGTPIREDTVATLETQGLTGLAFINLRGGSADSPRLQVRAGERYPVIQSRPSTWGRLDHAVEALVSNLIVVSKQFNQLLSDDNYRRIASILGHLDQLSGTLAGSSSSISRSLDDMSVTLQRTRDVSAELPIILAQIGAAATALERMADEVRNAGRSVRQVVRARDRDLQRFTGEALPEAAVAINELRRAAQNLRLFSEQLERDPGVLLRGPAPRVPGPGE